MTVLKTFGLIVAIVSLLLKEAAPFAVQPPLNPRRGQSLSQGGRTHDGLLKVPSKDLPSSFLCLSCLFVPSTHHNLTFIPLDGSSRCSFGGNPSPDTSKEGLV